MVEKFMEEKETTFWKLEKKGIRCSVCHFSCSIPEKRKGICEVRENRKNILFLSEFGKIDGLEVNRAEERSLYHFIPGNLVLAVDMKSPKNFKVMPKVESLKKKMNPQELVSYAKSKGVKAIFFTGSESVGHFEYVVKVFREARRSNVKTILGTVGLLNEDPIKKIAKYIDGLVFYFFASGNEDYYKKYGLIKNVEYCFDNLKFLFRYRMFIEIVNVLKKGYEDEENCVKLANWIVSNIGAEIPFHIVRDNVKLSVMEMKNLHTKCKEAGLRYVYIDGTKDSLLESTYCHNCGTLIAERFNNKLKSLNLTGERCPNCGIKHNFLLE